MFGDLLERSSLYMDRLRNIGTKVYKAINRMSQEFVQDLLVTKANVHDLNGQQQNEVV